MFVSVLLTRRAGDVGHVVVQRVNIPVQLKGLMARHPTSRYRGQPFSPSQASTHFDIKLCKHCLCPEPRTSTLMFQRHKLEKEVGEDTMKQSAEGRALASRFGRIHGLSSTLNLVFLGAVHVHMWYLAYSLVL